MASIIAIGNPASGKSTILNALAGKVLFKSGSSFGHGVTYELKKAISAKGTFYDTPGLADKLYYKTYYRQAAGKVISDSLREGGPFKLLFIVRTESGKVVEEDIVMLKLVLDATPEAGNNYGVIINKVPENVAKDLENPKDKKIFLTKLFNGIEETRRCTPSNITYILQKSELHAVDNALVDLDDLNTLQGDKFFDFVYFQVPTVQLTAGEANDIALDGFDISNPTTMLQQQIDQKQIEIDAAPDNDTRTMLQIQQLNLKLIFIRVKGSRC
jgi:GTPase Era involved in 16S rRNA processing